MALQLESLSLAVNYLAEKGFTKTFDFKDQVLECVEDEKYYAPSDLKIVETYRFEGSTNPDDSSVVYALQAKDGIKGLLIDAYGAYADADKAQFIINIPKA